MLDNPDIRYDVLATEEDHPLSNVETSDEKHIGRRLSVQEVIQTASRRLSNSGTSNNPRITDFNHGFESRTCIADLTNEEIVFTNRGIAPVRSIRPHCASDLICSTENETVSPGLRQSPSPGSFLVRMEPPQQTLLLRARGRSVLQSNHKSIHALRSKIKRSVPTINGFA